MRKRISVLSAVLMAAVMLCCACASKKTETAADPNEYTVYYTNQSGTDIGAVKSQVISENSADQLEALIKLLSTQPENAQYKAMLGTAVTLNGHELADGSLTLDFGSDYTKMSKTEEVLFRASVVQTLTQVKGVKYVLFTVNGSPLLDDNGEPVGIMRANSFIDDTGTEINAYSKAKIRLYFTDRQGKHLIARDEEAVYSSNMSLEKLVVEKLIEGPDTDEVYPTIAPDTKLISVTVKDGTCYVNFDAALSDKPYDVAENVVIYSIVDSLSELVDVNKVQILIDGKNDGVLFSKMSLNTIYESNYDLLTVSENAEDTDKK